MENKIYEEIHEKQMKTSKRYMKYFNIPDSEEVCEIIPKKNLDYKVILNKLKLLENIDEPLEIINKFHDELYKEGIGLGVKSGIYLVIESIRKNPENFEKILEIDPNSYVDFNFIPTYAEDMIEAIKNE